MGKLILLTFTSRFFSAAINFGIIVLLSRFLGPEGKGLASRLLVTVSGIQICCDFMGGAAMVYLSSRFRLRDLIVPAWIWAAVVCAAALLVVHASDPVLFSVYGLHIGLLAFLGATLNQHIHLFNGRERFRTSNLLTLGQAGITATVLWLLLQYDPVPGTYTWALYAGWGIPWLLSGLLLLSLPETHPPGGYKKSSLSLFRYASANQGGHLIQFITQRIAFFLLPAFTLGIYSNAISISESTWMIASSMAMIQFGHISNSDDREKATRLTILLFKAAVVLTALAAVILCILPETLFTGLFGPGFAPVGRLLPILLPGVVCISGYLIIGHYFSGMGLFRINNIALLSGMLTTLAGYGLLHLRDKGPVSDTAAAWITSCSNAVIFFSVLWLFRKRNGTRLRELIPHRQDLEKVLALIRSRFQRN